MYKKLLPALAFITLQSAVFAQSTDAVAIKNISDEVLTNGTAYSNLRYFCKQIGPRLTGSANAQKAVEAGMKMLQQAGADTVYLQQCMVPHWVRGEKEQGFIQVANEAKYLLHLCALGNAVGTGKNGITANVVEVKSFKALDEMGVAGLKGKIVFFNFEMNPTYLQTFTAYSESGIARREGPSKAAAYGAIGAMVRSLASNLDDFPHTGATNYNDSFPKIAAVAISTNDAEWLSQQLKKTKQVTASFTTSCAMLADNISYNVVGEMRGMEFPKEIITVGGHLDSWDLAEGAQDDGAGCVQSIEVMRVLKATHVQPKRTIRAVLFMNEENGGRGSDKYLELAQLNKEKHLFALESDAGGFTPRGFRLDMSESQMKKIAAWKDLFYPYGVYDFAEGESGSDVESLKEIGTALAGLGPDSQRYFDIHHAVTDIFENVSKRELNLGAVNMAALIYLIDKYGL